MPASTAEPAAPAAATPPPPSPGALLRQARERAGLGPEDLAGQLKLARSTLEALERDDFAALSEPVYVRGYYRKIAKVLALSEQEVLEAYNRCSQPPPAAPAMRRIPLAGGVAAGTSRQYRGRGLWLLAGAGVIVAALFALADREPPRRLAATATAEPEAEAPAPAASAGATPAPAAPDADTAAAAPPATATEAAAPPPEAAAPAAPGQLVLEFNEASFVRVEDSRARTLAIGLVRGGERQVLEGTPPYTVFLGNAQNVKVQFGGTPVDFSAHINRQNDTARFTVP